jgi:hypothetical protein
LRFENEKAANPSQRQPVSGELHDLFNREDLLARVPSLAALRSCRLYHPFDIQAAKKRGLNTEHLRDLADGEESRVVVIEWS